MGILNNVLKPNLRKSWLSKLSSHVYASMFCSTNNVLHNTTIFTKPRTNDITQELLHIHTFLSLTINDAKVAAV